MRVILTNEMIFNELNLKQKAQTFRFFLLDLMVLK